MVMIALKSELLANLTDPQIDAMVEAMLLAATADGELDETELAQLRHNLLNVDHMWLSHIDLERRIATARQHLTGHTRAERLTALQVVLDKQEQRVAALELAALVMTSDGVIRTSERDLMLEAADALGVDTAIAADIMAHVGKSVG
jgi:tellurite resistance protein